MPPAGTGTWRVTYQTPTVGLDSQSGHAVDGINVGFVTGRGVSGKVFIPRTAYTADRVRAAIADHVKELDAVHDLTG